MADTILKIDSLRMAQPPLMVVMRPSCGSTLSSRHGRFDRSQRIFGSRLSPWHALNAFDCVEQPSAGESASRQQLRVQSVFDEGSPGVVSHSTIATFEDDAGAYDQRDAGGFIKLNALRMRIAANARAKRG